jgi:hypothetical protein
MMMMMMMMMSSIAEIVTVWSSMTLYQIFTCMIVAILSMTSMHSIYQTTHEEGLHACIADNHRNECRQSKQSLSLLLRLSHAIEFDPDGKVTKVLTVVSCN